MITGMKVETAPGHWILARIGKRVLRPGGIELTQKLVSGLKITKDDKVLEYAPGLGITAKMTLALKPATYTGVELHPLAAEKLRKKFEKNEGNTKINIVEANARETGLADASATKLYGEAMLTMQSDKEKTAIISEAHRLLEVGGRYGIHELGLKPENISEEKKAEIFRALSKVIRVNARPLTVAEWSEKLETQGFKVLEAHTNPMHLLSPKRMIKDEKLRMFKILFNSIRMPKERKRMIAMRKCFMQYKDYLCAVAIIAEKE